MNDMRDDLIKFNQQKKQMLQKEIQKCDEVISKLEDKHITCRELFDLSKETRHIHKDKPCLVLRVNQYVKEDYIESQRDKLEEQYGGNILILPYELELIKEV